MTTNAATNALPPLPSHGTRDFVVTCPKNMWEGWIREGGIAGFDTPGDWDYHFTTGKRPSPDMQPGCRIYIVAHGRVRGYAPLVRIDNETWGPTRWSLVRQGGAVACTIEEDVVGFRGIRRVWWDQDSDERSYPNWLVDNVTGLSADLVRDLTEDGLIQPALATARVA